MATFTLSYWKGKPDTVTLKNNLVISSSTEAMLNLGLSNAIPRYIP